jgi:hypothetical protein
MKSLVVLLWAASMSLDAAVPPQASPAASRTPTTLAAATVHTTPWPLVLPCAHPNRLWFARGVAGEIRWSSTDGATARSFEAKGDERSLPLTRDFPTGRLDRVSGAAVPTVRASPAEHRRWMGLWCANGGALAWEVCETSTCPLSVAYLAGPRPLATRVDRWTRPHPSPRRDDAQEKHGSLFLNQISDRKPADEARASMAARFSRDIAADFRDMLAFACPARRCGPLAEASDAAMRAFLRAKDAAVTPVAYRAWGQVNRDTVWTATGGGARFETGCSVVTEPSWVGCWLKVDLPGDVQAIYHPRTGYGPWERDLAFRRKGAAGAELGAIDLLDAPGHAPGTRLELSDQALALRP